MGFDVAFVLEVEGAHGLFGTDLTMPFMHDHDERFVVLDPLIGFPIFILVVAGEELRLRVEGRERPIESGSYLTGGFGEFFEQEESFPDGVLSPKRAAFLSNGVSHLVRTGTFHKELL